MKKKKPSGKTSIEYIRTFLEQNIYTYIVAHVNNSIYSSVYAECSITAIDSNCIEREKIAENFLCAHTHTSPVSGVRSTHPFNSDRVRLQCRARGHA